MNSAPYWGATSSGSQDVPINFYIPGTSLNSAQILIGSTFVNSSGHPTPAAYNFSLWLNNNLTLNNIGSGNFTYLYYDAVAQGINYPYSFYNYYANLNLTNLQVGTINSFYIKFLNAQGHTTLNYNTLPWFSILANYTTQISVPQGCINTTSYFPDLTGEANYNTGKGTIYDPSTSTVTPISNIRSVSWNTLSTSDYNLSTPFVITGLPNSGSGTASAVGSSCIVNLPANNTLFDAYTVVNAYGADDGCIVQVKDSTGTWNTVFTSWNTTSRSDGGYGNVPGIVTLHDSITDPSYDPAKDPLKVGNNTVRIIIYDVADSGSDYDMLGLKNSYTTITYSSLPIRWDTFPFDSSQGIGSGSQNSLTESKRFNIDPGAMNALLFIGVGSHMRSISVSASTANNSISNTIYPTNSNIPFVLNLSQYDTTHVFTYSDGSLKPGNYTLNVTVIPSLGYESGDLPNNYNIPISYGTYGSPDIYSGTRIGILYPELLNNMWSTNFANTPGAAEAAANASLYDTYLDPLRAQGFYVNDSLVKLEAVYSGNVPNAIPIRLTLWKQ